MRRVLHMWRPRRRLVSSERGVWGPELRWKRRPWRARREVLEELAEVLEVRADLAAKRGRVRRAAAYLALSDEYWKELATCR